MKDIYNHVVYYVFSLVLLCTPPRVSAEETLPEKEKQAQERKTPGLPPKNSGETSASSPPSDGQTKPGTFAVPETTVPGQKENDYKTESSTTATKTDTPLRDVPQSVSVVTESLVKSQNAFNLRDALKNVSGLTISAAEGGRTGDSINVRGFAANSDFYLDGVKDNGQYVRDSFFIEQVEVLKGPNALLNGVAPNGGVGGTINLIPKHAGDEPLTQFTPDYGLDSQFGGHVDIGRRYGKNKEFGIRFNGVYRDGDTAIDHQSRESRLAAFGLDYQGDRLRLSTDFGYQEQDLEGVTDFTSLDAGVPVPKAPDNHNNYDGPNDFSHPKVFWLMSSICAFCDKKGQ